MSKYILVYEVDAHIGDGGGTFIEEFGMEERDMHKRVDALVAMYRETLEIKAAGLLQVEYKYKTIEYATRVEPERI